MALDEFKTQVLLLHSEQRTLDALSSEFGDDYTVHCATSGSEALNALGDTPINVIISAQDLPGMSGLEALREAKKRSPDTIGILLAEQSDHGLEALVGDKEVFQIIRGHVTSESILKAIDDATQQDRMMTLAESANDTAANVDQFAPEHIVMETSENGSTIISDGSGRMPALDPAKVPTADTTTVDLLVLSKDEEFLSTMKDSARGMHAVHYANTLAQAVKSIEDHPIGVTVIDAAMVGERVEQLTQHLQKSSPRLVCIVAGRRDDGEMLMDLINRGKVYRFLLKPVSTGRARLAVEASVKHHLVAPDTAFAKSPSETAQQPASAKATQSDVRQPKTPDTKPANEPTINGADEPVTTPPTAPAPRSPVDSTGEFDVNDELVDTFGEADTGFTETVTGLFHTVTKKLSVGGNALEPSEPAALSASGLTSTAEIEVASRPRKTWLLGAVSAALVILAVAVFWFATGANDTPIDDAPGLNTTSITENIENTEVAEADAVFEAPVDKPAAVDVDAFLEEARAAREAGQLLDPAGSSALDLYAAAVSAQPGNTVAEAELQTTIDQVLAMAEMAMLESRLDDAGTLLERVKSVRPGNVRLPFLTAQLSQLKLREILVEARTAIRESQFEVASTMLASARAMDVADETEIDAIELELSTARSKQQSEDVLAMANARIEDGSLVSPPNDNARYYYELALSNDPDNIAAQQGLGVVASKLALQARSEIENGDLDSAGGLLGTANELDPSNAELAAAVVALSDARDAALEDLRQAETNRLAEEKRRAAAASAATVQETRKDALEPDQETAAVEAVSSDEKTAEPETASAADALADEDIAADNQPRDKELIEAPVTNPNPTPTAVSSLSRIKYVAPKYPRAAQRRNLSGWVDVVFTVALDGSVKDIEIRNSEPGDTFVNAATKAVEKWQFEPVIENDTSVEKRAAVRMMFALE